MRNRVPTPGKEGRMLITPENGSKPFYATVTMADEPLDEGSPLAQETLLTDETALAMNLIPFSAVPETVFAKLAPYFQYCWRRTRLQNTLVYVEVLSEASTYFLYKFQRDVPSNTLNPVANVIRYSKDIHIDEVTGEITLLNPVEFVASTYDAFGALVLNVDGVNEMLAQAPIYAQGRVDGYNSNGYPASSIGYVFRIPYGATLGDTFVYGLGNSGFTTEYCYIRGNQNATVSAQIVTTKRIAVPAGESQTVYSIDRNAYPDFGEVGDWVYRFLGKPSDLAAYGVKTATGSYLGTGTNGKDNECKLTFDFEPHAVFIASEDRYACAIVFPTIYAGQMFYSSATERLSVSYSAGEVTWSAESAYSQLNFAGTAYKYFAIGQ